MSQLYLVIQCNKDKCRRWSSTVIDRNKRDHTFRCRYCFKTQAYTTDDLNVFNQKLIFMDVFDVKHGAEVCARLNDPGRQR